MNENMIFKEHVSVMNVDIHNDEIESTKAVVRSFDYDTGKFTYKLTKDGVPLSLSGTTKVNVTLMFGRETKAVLNATTVNSVESIISFVYPEQFLSYSGQVLGEVSIQYDNGQTMVAGYFSFVSKGSYIDEYSGEIQKFYVERFEDLDSLITEQAKETEIKVGDMNEKVTVIEKKIEEILEEGPGEILSEIVEARDKEKDLNTRLERDKRQFPTYVKATETSDGLMSKEDKKKLDGLPSITLTKVGTV